MCAPPPTHTHFSSPSYATGIIIMHKFIHPYVTEQFDIAIINRLLKLNDFVIYAQFTSSPKTAKFIEKL